MARRDSASSCNSSWHEAVGWRPVFAITPTQNSQMMENVWCWTRGNNRRVGNSVVFRLHPRFYSSLWCVVFAVSLLPIYLLRNMLAFLTSSTVQTSWVYVCVREFKNGMLLSERDVYVMIRVGDRVCSLGFQCFVLCGYYQTKRKLKGLIFHFPRLGSCWFREKEGKCWKVFRRDLEAGQASDG